MGMRRAGVLLSIAALLFAACGTEETPEAAAPSAIDVRAANYTFASPATVPAGAVTISMENAGPEPHQAQLMKLKAGDDAKKVIAAAKSKAGDAAVLAMGTLAGGPNAVDAGESQVSTETLDAGNYVFFCLVPDPKGRSHASLGMVKDVTVEANDDPAEAPAADYTAATKEFDFELPEAWNGSIAVTNKGKQPHELQIMEIAEGKTEKDFTDWFKAAPGTAGPPTWTTGGGVASIAPGGTDTFEANVEPGVYFLMCFVPDPEKKAPHFALGMLKRFEVT
jgi:hypothetical protein